MGTNDHCLQRGKGPWDSDDSVFNSDKSDIDLEEHENLFGNAEAALNIAHKQAGMAKFRVYDVSSLSKNDEAFVFICQQEAHVIITL